MPHEHHEHKAKFSTERKYTVLGLPGTMTRSNSEAWFNAIMTFMLILKWYYDSERILVMGVIEIHVL